MKKQHDYWVYIVTNWKRTVLYTGVTNNLARRLTEHYEYRGKPETFAGKYFCYNLVYYEWYQYISEAIAREKELKSLLREKKRALIEDANPEYTFLNTIFCEKWPPPKAKFE